MTNNNVSHKLNGEYLPHYLLKRWTSFVIFLLRSCKRGSCGDLPSKQVVASSSLVSRSTDRNGSLFTS